MSRPRLAIGRRALLAAATVCPRPIRYADLASVLGCSRVTAAAIVRREGMTLADLEGVSFPRLSPPDDDTSMEYPFRASEPDLTYTCSVCGDPVRESRATVLRADGRVTAVAHQVLLPGNDCRPPHRTPVDGVADLRGRGARARSARSAVVAPHRPPIAA